MTSHKIRRLNGKIRLAALLLVLHCGATHATTNSDLVVNLLYLSEQRPSIAVLSNLTVMPEDLGVAGAKLGVADNDSTGRFLKQRFTLNVVSSADRNVIVEKARDWVQSDSGIIVADLTTDTLLAVSSALQNTKHVLINATNPDDTLRTEQCRSALFHTTPSRAMLADALAQFLKARRWQKWFLVRGARQEDHAYAAALERAAKRFGATIKERRDWTFDTDLRRSAQKEVPGFTQAREYDVTLVADEAGDFGEYFPYNTWLPRPVAGTQGLSPTAWHWSIEQWGAAQLQNRFVRANNRTMRSADYGAWLAIRAIGEAVLRGAKDSASIQRFFLSPDFELAGFLGRGLTFRDWNGQLRQPVALVQPNALISLSPQEGFLHPHTDLDTLGFDRPEVQCSITR